MIVLPSTSAGLSSLPRTQNRRVTLSNGKSYSYQLPWDGKLRLRGPTFKSPIAFDTETEIVPEAEKYARIPCLALATASTGTASVILHPSQVTAFLALHAKEHFVMQNAVFDYWVVHEHLQKHGNKTMVGWWEDIPHEGRLHDTLILDMLVRLAQGAGSEASADESQLTKRNLGELAWDYANVKVDKEDPYRKRYGELLDVEWGPSLLSESGWWDYPIKDAIVTAAVYRRQSQIAEALIAEARKRHSRDFKPGVEKAYGLLTEALQTRAAIVLEAVTRRGVKVNPAQAKERALVIQEQIAAQVAVMERLHPEVLMYPKPPRQPRANRGKRSKKGGCGQQQLFAPPIEPAIAEKTLRPLITEKGRPRLQQKPLKAVLEKVAFEANEPVPLSTGKKGGTSLSVGAWAPFAKHSPFVKAWAKTNVLAKHLSFFSLFQQGDVLHPHYKVLMRTGRTSCYRPNLQQCCDGETEVLTHRGWAPLETVTALKPEEVKIAQYDATSGEVTFVNPEQWVVQEYQGNFVTLQNDHIDLCLTPDHRCLLRHRKHGALQVFMAEDYPEDWEQLHAGHYAGGDDATETLSVDELRLAIAFQADGSWSWQKHQIEFSVKLGRKKERLEVLFKACDQKFTVKDKKGKEGEVRYVVTPSSFTRTLYGLMGPKKLFGPWLLSLSREHLDAFCEEIWLWDATAEKATGYASQEQTNADWVQTVLSLSGRRAQVRVYESDTSTSYQVDHTDDTDCSSTTGVRNESVSPQDGRVYCATVPSGYLLVRRGGKVHITGNCPRDADFRSLFVAKPGHLLFTVDYSFIELRTLAVVCEDRFGKSVLGDTIRKGIDPHAYTAAMVLGVSLQDFLNLKAADPKKFKDARQAAKAVNFGVPGGLGPVKLAAYARANYGVEMTVEEAATLRHRLINDIYPELGLYLGDSTLPAMAYTLGLSEKRVRKILGLADYDDEELVRRGARAISKILRGTPQKADGTPYKPRFVERVWRAMERLVTSTNRLPLWAREHVKQHVGSKALEALFGCAMATTRTGRVRGRATYTQQKNTPFQSLAADGAKEAMWRLHRAGFSILMFVHDEIVLELPEATAERDARYAEALIVDGMASVLSGFPVACEGSVGPCWAKS